MSVQHETPTGVAIVGCGLIGKKRATHLKAASTLAPSTARLLYACDLDLARATDLARMHPGSKQVTDYLVALADPGVSAVIVATINAALAPVTLAAVKAGKHVLVEKPGAIRSAELREIQVAAAQTGAQVRIGYNHRFHPALRKARELIDSGALGPLMFLRGRYGHGGRKGYDREWRVEGTKSDNAREIDPGPGEALGTLIANRHRTPGHLLEIADQLRPPVTIPDDTNSSNGVEKQGGISDRAEGPLA
jgi:predicted dehydrogenase